MERAASLEKAPATSVKARSSSAAILCTGPMKEPAPPPTMAMRIGRFDAIRKSPPGLGNRGQA